jgi:nucleoside-diphosphate-sugar epimerase
MDFIRVFGMKILVVGAGGNLGFEFCAKRKNGLEIYTASANPANCADLLVVPFDGIFGIPGKEIDLVLNFANSYYPAPSPSEEILMRNAIVGVAEAIVEFSRPREIPVISFATYFQFAPVESQPWSEYSALKDIASEIYRNSNSPWMEIVLRDNYGGRRQGKFFDRVLAANLSGSSLNATDGYSLVNLIHVNDIVAFVHQSVFEMLSDTHNFRTRYELRSQNSLTLRKLVEIVDVNRDHPTRVNWGELSYRENEVFEDWISAELPDDWQPKESIIKYIRNYGLE